MVDYFSLALSHGVLLIAFWRLMLRDDLDSEALGEEQAGEAEGEASPPPPNRTMRRA